ncbi:MAG TPA: ABC transporter permease subunit, partial [Candidatus Sumerlaeia bacterium]|nr:ABC transporter permease subunit [Candidatus Sumerlaeia bacterium]
MSKIWAIAFNTFKEAVRNRILYILLVFALLIMASSGIVGELTISARERIITDLGITSINFFGLLIAIFVGIGLVYNELDKKTIYTIVTKPIDRHQFLIGKYLGLLLTIYINILIMVF